MAVIEGGVIYYIRTDHIGRPVFATNASGAKVWTASYLPFGGVHTTIGTPINLRFPGQWFQSESGLHQNWMRDYDPTTGRYIQADPLGLIDGASVYGYVGQNPGRYVDPTGECIQFGPWAPACAAAVGAVVNVAIGYAIEQIWGDGCYTWDDAGRDAAIGAAFGMWGRGVSSAARATGASAVGKAAATAFKSSHYAPRLQAAGVNVSRAEAAVGNEVAAMRPSLFAGADFNGRLLIDNVLIEYRGRLLPSGLVNIGTIFPVR